MVYDLIKAQYEAYSANLNKISVPECPKAYEDLQSEMQISLEKFPKAYQDNYIMPFIDSLNKVGKRNVEGCLRAEGEDSDYAIIAQPILQQSRNFEQVATDAFQEVVSDLYDGFLSREDRANSGLPGHCVAPLIAWLPSWLKGEGKPVPTGPCTITSDVLNNSFGIKTGIVYLPVQYSKNGLLLWAVIGHETAGHDILNASDGLRNELYANVREKLKQDLRLGETDPLVDYWSSRIDEAASDVMGILNMGPAVAMALIGFLRASRAAFDKKTRYRLSSVGLKEDIHPADVLRVYMAAYVVGNLKSNPGEFSESKIINEADHDLDNFPELGKEIRINAMPKKGFTGVDDQSGIKIARDIAKQSAKAVADTIVKTPMRTLNSNSLGEIQNWYNEDEEKANGLIPNLTSIRPIPDIDSEVIYAAHVVAAAIYAALTENNMDINLVFKNMVTMLEFMHSKNPVWTLPIYLEHPGNLDYEKKKKLSNNLYSTWKTGTTLNPS